VAATSGDTAMLSGRGMQPWSLGYVAALILITQAGKHKYIKAISKCLLSTPGSESIHHTIFIEKKFSIWIEYAIIKLTENRDRLQCLIIVINALF